MAAKAMLKIFAGAAQVYPKNLILKPLGLLASLEKNK